VAVTIFTTGSPSYGKSADGADVVRIDFDTDDPGAYQRLELPDGARLETTGAVAESFG
jgi:hypothetical protein